LDAMGSKINGKPLKFIVCGHSLGGILAIITGNYIKALDKTRVVQVITIGTPAVFMKGEETEKSYLKKEHIINIAHPRDPVFYLNGVKGLQGTHVGIPVLLNDNYSTKFPWMFAKNDIARYRSNIEDLYENFQK
jgi:predicted lipase